MVKWMQADRWGMGLSLLCSLHCLVVPVTFALLPSLYVALHSFRDPLRPWALGLLHLQRFDLHLAVIAMGFALVTVLLGWRRHRRWSPLLWLLPAAVAFFVGLTRNTLGWAHSLTLALGGLFLMIAHASNLRWQAKCRVSQAGAEPGV